MVAMFCMNYFLVFFLVASGTCELIETGQFFKLNENKDSEDSSVPGKNNDQILNEDFFKCQAKEEKCSVVTKQNKKTQKKDIWSKIYRKYMHSKKLLLQQMDPIMKLVDLVLYP